MYDNKLDKVQFSLPKKISYSQIYTYSQCPYKYRFRYLLKFPSQPSKYLSFGRAIHRAIEKYNKGVMAMSVPTQSSLFLSVEATLPTKDDLYQWFLEYMKNEWFLNQKERSFYIERGKLLLSTFYDQEQKDTNVIIAAEKRFSVEIDNVQIHGQIDRIDLNDKNNIEVVDYKSGKVKEVPTLKEKEQLFIYAMAIEKNKEISINKKVTTLSFYYLADGGKKVSFKMNDEERNSLVTKITSTVKKIKEYKFTPTPSYATCVYCDFKDKCTFATLQKKEIQ